ncbi:hypothetical protein GCM10023084_03090 [Streptomyces lacrimifluminis]
MLAWPAEWPVPELPAVKQRRSRGLPMGPVLAGAGNGTTMLTTAAYSVGGPMAAAATGVVVAAGATAMALRRRAAVRRGVAVRAGGATSGGRGGAGSGLRGGGGSGATRSGGGLWRSPGGGRSGGGSALRGGGGRSGGGLRRSGSGGGLGGGTRGGGGASRSGLLPGKGGGHRGPGRGTDGGGGLRKDSSRRHKRAAEKAAAKAGKRAAEKALKQAAKKKPASADATGRRHALKAAAARTARAAWNATRPHAVRVRQAAARQARRARGALWDGLCAAAAGAWTLMRHGRPAALDRLKKVWKRRRTGRLAQPPATPTVAATVRRPAHIPNSPSTGGPMSGGGHHFVAPAMELARAAANYRPQGMLQVGADFAGLEEALRLHAEAMKITVENADANQPLAPQIVELMRQVHGLQLKAAELAAELTPAFRQLHDVDIARLENPRKGAAEAMWDYRANL